MRKNDVAHYLLLETPHAVQLFGQLKDDSILLVAKSLRVPLSQGSGGVIFYRHFNLKPSGKHAVEHPYRQTRRCGREAAWRSARTDHQERTDQLDNCALCPSMRPGADVKPEANDARDHVCLRPRNQAEGRSHSTSACHSSSSVGRLKRRPARAYQ